MYYKLYIDSVFVLQGLMNVYLLILAKRVLRCTATHKRILLGAFVGDCLMCFLLLLPVFSLYGRMLAGAIPVSMCMMWISFGIRKKLLFRSSLVMAGCGFFIGSIMIWILNRLRVIMKEGAGVILTAAVGGMACLLLSYLTKAFYERRERAVYTVRIPVPDLKSDIRIKAFMDTGNHLAEPVSGRPVCLISEKGAQNLHSLFLPEKYHAIPYRSVGKANGILDAYEIPFMVIEEACKEAEREKVILAICNMGISKESPYQMILHPRLLEN